MVQAIINIDDRSNRVLNLVKAKYGLKDKSEAIERVALEYEENILEPQLKPEYIQKAKLIIKENPTKVRTTDNLRKKLGL